MSSRGPNLSRLCQRTVERARALGATQAEAFAERSRRTAVRVRDEQVEDVSQSTGKGIGLRVVKAGRLGFAYTSDVSNTGLEMLAQTALNLAGVSAKDRFNRLPAARVLAERNGARKSLYDGEVEELGVDWAIEAGKVMERVGRAEDPRVTNFDAVGGGTFFTEVAIASSEGLADRYRGSYVYLYSMPVARSDDGQLQTGYWVDYRRALQDLAAPEEVGRIAARRAARMVGARQAKTQRVPVVFDPLIAASFVSGIAAAVNGDLVHKRASFLGDKLGSVIAPEPITIVNDGTLRGGLATAPFDGEGVATRRTPIVERGVLRNFLYDCYTAAKAKKQTTGSASRGYASIPRIGTSNFYLEAGDQTPEQILAGVKNGFYVTSMLGRGANAITGDYSRGAAGLWIRDGELAEPVHEVTVAGHMLEMLNAIDAVGSDLDFRGSAGAPTIRFSELTVSGS